LHIGHKKINGQQRPEPECPAFALPHEDTLLNRDLSREAGIKIGRDFPSPLWSHFRREVRSHRLWAQFSIFFVDLPAMLELPACRRILSFGHG
jgi:hypothetical protein